MVFKKLFKVYFSVVGVLAVTGFSQSVTAKDEAMICADTKVIAWSAAIDTIQST